MCQVVIRPPCDPFKPSIDNVHLSGKDYISSLRIKEKRDRREEPMSVKGIGIELSGWRSRETQKAQKKETQKAKTFGMFFCSGSHKGFQPSRGGRKPL